MLCFVIRQFIGRIDNYSRIRRTINFMTAQCIVSFGSNLGNRLELMASAASMIARSSLILSTLKTSRLFETPAIGGPGGQEPFLNAIGAFETAATARQILDLLQQVEMDLGRHRRRRWDARSIDLDVVLHGELVGGGMGLTVPHPRYTARQFVLQPACDVAAHFRDPRFGWTLRRLADHVSAGLPSLALVGCTSQTRQEICKRLSNEHGIQTFASYPAVQSIPVVANVPAMRLPNSVGGSGSVKGSSETVPDGQSGEPIIVTDQPWVAAYLPQLPLAGKDESFAGGPTTLPTVPRLIARLQRTTAQTRWPAPHQMWPAGWDWPEYRLEIDDLDWAVNEVASALDSMRCPVVPVTEDGNWWQ